MFIRFATGVKRKKRIGCSLSEHKKSAEKVIRWKRNEMKLGL